MNNSIFLRLVWKEYRLQRALWISMVLLTGMLMFIVHLFALDETERFSWQLLVGLSMPALYCVGMGAILFAGEREAETYEFQRSLPVNAARVFAAKITFATLGTAAMFGLFWAALLILRPAGVFEPVQMAHTYSVEVAKRMPLFGIVLLLWTIFFSLRLRKVLLAAVLGVVVGSFYFDVSSGWWCKLWGDFRIAWELIVLTAAIALVDVWFGLRWFRQRKERCREPSSTITNLSGSAEYAVVQTNCEPIPVATDRLIILGRLTWQHWRQSSRLIMVLVGLTLLPLAVIGVEWLVTGELPTRLWDKMAQDYDPVANVLGWVGICPALLSVALLGLIAFHPDQWGRGYRFLADRGMSPRYVWLSRQLVCWTAAVAVLPGWLAAVYLLTPSLLNCSGQGYPTWLFMQLGAVTVGGVILSTAVGQFMSMFFRSGILAGLFSIILTTILAAWCALMWLWGVSWLWSMLPIPVALLLASRLRVRDWLVERNTFLAWLRPGLTLAIPTAVLIIAVPMYRVYQIPYVDPGFSPDEFAREMTPEERATFKQYEDVLGKAQSLYGSKRYIEQSSSAAVQAEYEEILTLALEASRGELYDPQCQLFNLVPGFPILTEWFIDSADKLTKQGHLDEALEKYLAAIRIAGQVRDWFEYAFTNPMDSYYTNDTESLAYQRLRKWSVHPGQTTERIRKAERRLKQITAGFMPNNVVKLRYPLFRRFINGDLSALESPYDEIQTQPNKNVAYMLSLPWERARCLRILNQMTRNQLDMIDKMEQQLTADEPLDLPTVIQLPDHWLKPSLIDVIHAPDCCMYYNRPFDIFQYIRKLAAIETERRATRIILALEAWKLQHGSLPRTLDELVGTCLEELPNDPYTGQPFRYFPDGVKHSFSTETKENDFRYDTMEISASQPFLWAAGPNVKLRQYIGAGGEIDLHRYAVRDARSELAEWRMPITENKIWSSGLVFPIP